MKPWLTVLLLVAPIVVAAAALPESIERWKKQAEFFWAMDYRDPAVFKAELKAYFAKVYRGLLLEKMNKWVDEGHLESEYYSSFFDAHKDTKILTVAKKPRNLYLASAKQASCYDLTYNAPVIQTIVADFKIRNLTQSDIDAWYQASHLDGEICLEIHSTITFQLSQADGLIEAESSEISHSLAKLSPNKVLQSDGARPAGERRG